MKIQLSSEVTADGALTKASLERAIAALPDGAVLTIETWDSQRDGAGFRVRARWVEDR